MKGRKNENLLTFVKEYEFIKPDIHKIDSLTDKCITDCHNKSFHTFKYRCIYNIKFTNIGNIEIVGFSIADEETNLYDLQKLEIARRNDFIFNQIKNLKN